MHKGDWDKSAGPLKDFDFHLSWISACRRVLKPEGTIWISGTYHSIYQCGFALQKEGFRILNDIAWHKPNAPPNIGCRCFSASHESLIWACKDKKATHTFNYLDMKQSAWKGDFIKQPGKQMRSVWMINTAGLSEKKRVVILRKSHWLCWIGLFWPAPKRGIWFWILLQEVHYRDFCISFKEVFYWDR